MDVRLHSKYQPQLEAERYIEALSPRRDIGWYILIEPGLGYLIPALRRRCPASKIIALHADSVFRATEAEYPDVRMWFPDSGTGVQEFLERQIPEGEAARIIEWRPSLQFYGEKCLALARESADFIKRAEASRRTGAAFGRRWVRNFFRNLALIDHTLRYAAVDMPIVITGSGPSLEAALPEIRAGREGVFVLAASSSLPALASGGIAPDMVISTDGGGWALLHLHACFREPLPRGAAGGAEGGGRAVLAAALWAALPSQCANLPVLPINDGSLWQGMALHRIGAPSVLVPQRGTVTASALELALVLGTGDIFLGGMDLALRDMQSHARPYGFDHLFLGAASRLRPVYSQVFARSADMKAGGSHDVYAAWFKKRLSLLPQRVFPLGGSHPVFENRSAIGAGVDAGADAGASAGESFRAKARAAACARPQDYFKASALKGSPKERCRLAAEAIIAALGDSAPCAPASPAAILAAELGPLLFPARSGVKAREIADEIRGIALQYGKECG